MAILPACLHACVRPRRADTSHKPGTIFIAARYNSCARLRKVCCMCGCCVHECVIHAASLGSNCTDAHSPLHRCQPHPPRCAARTGLTRNFSTHRRDKVATLKRAELIVYQQIVADCEAHPTRHRDSCVTLLALPNRSPQALSRAKCLACLRIVF